ARLLRCRLDGDSRPVVVQTPRVQGERHDLCGPGGERDALVELDELGQRGDRMGRQVLDVLVPDLVTEDEVVRRAAVKEAERDSRVIRVDERALALDPKEVAP